MVYSSYRDHRAVELRRGYSLSVTLLRLFVQYVFIMGFKCAAYGCKSGYATNTDVDGVTFHAFPADPVLRNQWIRANPRKDFSPTKFSRICSLHFRDCDFIDVRQDSNKSRLKMKSEKPVRRRLREGAVPSIFSNVPAYLSSPAPSPRTTKAIASRRLADEERRLEELEASFNASDDITQMTHLEISQSLQSDSSAPQGFIVNNVNECLLIYMLRMTNEVPRIVVSICLKSDMSVVCSLHDKVVPQSQYCDLLTNGHVTKLSQLINLMARLKSWQVDERSKQPFLFSTVRWRTLLTVTLKSSESWTLSMNNCVCCCIENTDGNIHHS